MYPGEIPGKQPVVPCSSSVRATTTMSERGSNVRGMHFTCERSWDDMTPMADGRFCDSCQKPVIDLTA